MADDRVQITYRGIPEFAGLLAKCLQDEGLEVEYEPPVEKRHGELGDAVTIVMLGAAGGTLGNLGSAALTAAARRGVQRFREWTKKAPPENQPEIEVEGDEE